MRLTVLTVSVVPAGIVAPFKETAAKQALHIPIVAIDFSKFTLV
jgi:hypothetical protein